MIKVLTTAYYDLSLLPFFIKYYAPLCDEIFIATDLDVSDYAVTPLPISDYQRKTGLCAQEIQHLKKIVASPNDWIIPADLDEFHQFDAPIEKIINHCLQQRFDHVIGVWQDHIAADGTLKETVKDVPLNEQYPQVGNISRHFGCLDRKVTLCRGYCNLQGGHHKVLGGQLAPHGIMIDHYRWRAGLIEALEERTKILKQNEKPWWQETDRIVKYFRKHGKYDAKDFE